MGSKSYDFDALRKSLSSEALVVTPDSEGYEDSLKRWSESNVKRALAVIQPTTTEDVSTAIKFCTSNKLPFVAVCGGHSTSGSNATDDGVCIDLGKKMKGVSVDPATKTITAQGGAFWKDVDVAAAAHGLATVGGTVNHTGIGGLTLGGGYGWLSGRYGMTVDNLLSATCVLASGEIVKCSESSEPDLFWALRGAGQSFGIVTEFVYKAYDQKNKVFAGIAIFTPDKLAQITEFSNKLIASGNTDVAMNWGFTAPPPANQPAVLAGIYYNDGDEAVAREYYKELLDLGPVMDTLTMMPYELLNGVLAAAAGYDGRKLFGGSNFTAPLDPAFTQAVFDKFTQTIMSEKDAGGSAVLFECIPNSKIRSVPRDATAFANRGDYYTFGLIWKWFDPALDTKFRQHNRELAEFVRNEGGTKKAGDVGNYSNYIGPEEKTESVFGVNSARLRTLKAKYDPDNWFNKFHRLLPN
ncbi:putative FAD binding oxidoreductase [Rhizodiscina lignyota]|uniref:FAD binding oxidoreductase n=1 Tax=Rhizodiscina lignyota TaxID=1504668 RepID=A0A9P4M1H8_9PEZI|nr:putative FAD binding oxidoreductase [Rhizodiscina lignyota]